MLTVTAGPVFKNPMVHVPLPVLAFVIVMQSADAVGGTVTRSGSPEPPLVMVSGTPEIVALVSTLSNGMPPQMVPPSGLALSGMRMFSVSVAPAATSLHVHGPASGKGPPQVPLPVVEVSSACENESVMTMLSRSMELGALLLITIW